MARSKAVCLCKFCGNTFEKYLYGSNKSDASRKAEWAEDTFDMCPDCFKEEKEREREEENKKAKEANAEAGLPELTGSEKQIAWAETLRNDMIKEATEYAIELKTDNKILNFFRNNNMKKNEKGLYVVADKETGLKLKELLVSIGYLTENGQRLKKSGRNVDLYIKGEHNKIIEYTNDQVDAALDMMKKQTDSRYWIDSSKEFSGYLQTNGEFHFGINHGNDCSIHGNGGVGALLRILSDLLCFKLVVKKTDDGKVTAVKKKVTYKKMKVSYYNYKNKLRDINGVYQQKDSYDADDKSIIILIDEDNTKLITKVEKILGIDEESKKQREEEKKVDETHKMRIDYYDFKQSTFGDKIKKQVYDSYRYSDKTVEVIVRTDEDMEFIKDYYEKNKKTIDRKKKRSALRKDEIEEYEIVPDKIDADKLEVNVPKELQNEQCA